jgi:hypothetical protein
MTNVMTPPQPTPTCAAPGANTRRLEQSEESCRYIESLHEQAGLVKTNQPAIRKHTTFGFTPGPYIKPFMIQNAARNDYMNKVTRPIVTTEETHSYNPTQFFKAWFLAPLMSR